MNLIHIDDITNVLMSLQSQHTTSDILNVPAQTPTRDAYYRYVCAQLKVPTSCFDHILGLIKLYPIKITQSVWDSTDSSNPFIIFI